MVQRSITYSAVEDFERRFVRPKQGRTLVVGSKVYPGRTDRRLLYEGRAVGWDALAGDGVDLVVDLEQPLLDDAAEFDHIDCMSVLEHTKRPWLVTTNLERLLLPGGTLYLTMPFIWREHAYPSDYWRCSIAGIRSLFRRIDWVATRYAHTGLTDEGERITGTRVHDYPFFARTEVCAFGVMSR